MNLANLVSASLKAGQSPHKSQRTKIVSRFKDNWVAAFKDPSFQDRVASAAKAKQKALDRLKAKPPVDEARAAEQRQAWEARAQILAEERAAKAEASALAKADKAAAKAAQLAEAQAAAELKAARLKPPTAAEMKAARDARYAARQARK